MCSLQNLALRDMETDVTFAVTLYSALPNHYVFGKLSSLQYGRMANKIFQQNLYWEIHVCYHWSSLLALMKNLNILEKNLLQTSWTWILVLCKTNTVRQVAFPRAVSNGSLLNPLHAGEQTLRFKSQTMHWTIEKVCLSLHSLSIVCKMQSRQ